jgi:hypothetical protein
LLFLFVIMATTTKVVNFGGMKIILHSCYDLPVCSWMLCIQALSNDNKVVCLRLPKFLALHDHENEFLRALAPLHKYKYSCSCSSVSLSGYLFKKVLSLYIVTTDVEVGQVTF